MATLEMGAKKISDVSLWNDGATFKARFNADDVTGAPDKDGGGVMNAIMNIDIATWLYSQLSVSSSHAAFLCSWHLNLELTEY